MKFLRVIFVAIFTLLFVRSEPAGAVEKCAGEFVVSTIELEGDAFHQVVVLADTSGCGEASVIKYQGWDEPSATWVDELVEPFNPKLESGRFSVKTKGKPPWVFVIAQKGFSIRCKIQNPTVANSAMVVTKQIGYDTVAGFKAKKAKLSCNSPNVSIFSGCNVQLPDSIESNVTQSGTVTLWKGKFKNFRPAGNPDAFEFCDADRLPFPLPLPLGFQPPY